MSATERKSGSWWGGISSIPSSIFSSATKRRQIELEPVTQSQPTQLAQPAQPSQQHSAHHVEPISQATPRPRISFQDRVQATEREPSPESPAHRASNAVLANRKMIDRARGPSGALTSSTIRSTNFSPVPKPRPMFRSSHAPETSRFNFSPRVTTGDPSRHGASSLSRMSDGSNFRTYDSVSNGFNLSTARRNLIPAPPTLRDNFNIGTPKRDLRPPTAESNGRSVTKTPINDAFPMKIPEPPAHLTGEAITKRIPHDPNRLGSIYADEFLYDLCPKEFNDLQRKQFFCILDLRRLKYVSNEVFQKKDWRLNISNFAKEYEKSRSLILLRYGLYEFKSIRPSREVVSQWKASNGIPDEDADAARKPATSTSSLSRPNGTEGILARSTAKRKAQDDQPKTQDRAAVPQNKRARAVEREPLAESATPTLNKGISPSPMMNRGISATPALTKSSKKRSADEVEDLEENPSAKVQKPTPSATLKFFENVANSKPSQPVSTAPAVQRPFAPLQGSKPKTSVFSSSVMGGAQNGKSVFDVAGPDRFASTSSNIFGHLSDTGSGQVSGNENDGGDEDDSGEEESEVQEVSQSDEPSVAASGVATPRPAGGLLSGQKRASALASSSASSEASEAPAGKTGPSLFDRITRDEDGNPKRILESDVAESSVPPSTGASDSERAPSPQKEVPFGGLNKTWTPNTPIKFGPSAGSAFPSATPKTSSALAPQDSSTPAVPKLFGSGSFTPAAPSQAASTPSFGLGASSSTTAPSLFAASVNGTASGMFGLGKKQEPAQSKPTAPVAAASAPLPRSKSPVKADSGSDSKAPVALFGSAPGQATAPTFNLGAGQTPRFDAGTKGAKPLFGSATADSAAPTFNLGTAQTPATGIGSDTPKPLFGSASGSATPKPGLDTAKTPMFGLGSTTEKPLFGSASGVATPQFGTAELSAPKPSVTSEPPKFTFGGNSSLSASPAVTGAGAASESSQSKPLFGGVFGSQKPADPKPLFGAGSGTATPTFGGTSTPTSEAAEPAPATSGLFGAAAPAASGAPSFGASTGPSLFGASTPATSTTPQPSILFGSASATGQNTSTPSILFGPSAPAAPATLAAPAAAPAFSFSFGGNPAASAAPAALAASAAPQSVSAPSSFTFGAGGDGSSFRNPFATDGNSNSALPTSFNFGSSSAGTQPAAPSTGNMFAFGAGGAGSATNGTTTPMFSFGGQSQADGITAPGQAPTNIFNLAPPMGGTSTGTNTPFTVAGASSLATTPAGGTPEPGATAEGAGEHEGQKADGDEEQQQAQINLTEGGPGEEDEDVIFEVRAKALKLCPATSDESDDKDSSAPAKKPASPWKTMGVGPFRILRHKKTGAVRALLRVEPRGNIALNKSILPKFTYKPEKGDKYVKMTTISDDGEGLETWMLQVKDPERGRALADALEKNKGGNSGAKKEEA